LKVFFFVERIVKKDVIDTGELPDIAKAMEKEEAKHRLVVVLYVYESEC